MEENQEAKAIQVEYTPRARDYDDARGGWHGELARDFVRWIDPVPGMMVLDLACGTGLVSFALAETMGIFDRGGTAFGSDAVTGMDTDGSGGDGDEDAQMKVSQQQQRQQGRDSMGNGIIVGVDITQGMLDVALGKIEEKRNKNEVRKSLVFMRGDITNEEVLDHAAEKARSMSRSHKESAGTRGYERSEESDGGPTRAIFDIITCCSALVLLPDPAKAVKLWTRYLKPSGRLILDVPTEDKNVYSLCNHMLRPKLAMKSVWGWPWVEGAHSVEKLFTDAGLSVLQTTRTHSYVGEKKYDVSQVMEIFESQDKLKNEFEREGKLEEARRMWPEVSQSMRRDSDGKLIDGHYLYVTVGRKV